CRCGAPSRGFDLEPRASLDEFPKRSGRAAYRGLRDVKRKRVHGRGFHMNSAAAVESASHLWSEEPSKLPGRRRIRARIGGLHCSLCTGTIEKALGRRPGVDKVAVSLTHEQALIEYDPSVARAEDLLQTLKDIGYTISDPNKLRPFVEEERALVHERGRFLIG